MSRRPSVRVRVALELALFERMMPNQPMSTEKLADLLLTGGLAAALKQCESCFLAAVQDADAEVRQERCR